MSLGIVRKNGDPHLPGSLFETESEREEGDKTLRRALLASDVPTVDEAALSSFYISVWSSRRPKSSKWWSIVNAMGPETK
jgi:hypothetical protein